MTDPHAPIHFSADFDQWLQQNQVSLAFTTYQTSHLIFVGSSPDTGAVFHGCLFDKPMGLFAHEDKLYMSTRYQIWQIENVLGKGEHYYTADRLYVPKVSYTTGNLNVHDVALDENGKLWFVNTDFSCLSSLAPGENFQVEWRPPFITKLTAEDQCHLNGLAMVEGKPTYMTACSTTNESAGWRNYRHGGGVIFHLPSNEIIAQGFSMPHSPRFYQGKLWVLNSGSGEFGYVEGGRFEPIVFCPGFVRGLAFWQHYALVGLSKLRSTTFGGLALEERLLQQGETSQCGLVIIDLQTGTIAHRLQVSHTIEELFDVVVLPGVQHPQCLDFQNEDIERLVRFAGSDGLITTKPTVKRASRDPGVMIAGLPRSDSDPGQASEVQKQLAEEAAWTRPAQPRNPAVKFQRVYHLTPDSLRPYDGVMFPSLVNRWLYHPLRGELVGVSASVTGELVGFVIAEVLAPEKAAEVISLYVEPLYRHQGIATRLMVFLEKALHQSGVETLSLTYQPSRWTETALEPLLRRLGWQYAPWYSLKKAEKKAQKKGISPTFTQVLPESSTQFFSQVSSQAVSQVFPNISPKFSPQFSFQLPPQSSAIETGSKSPSPLKIWLKQAKEHLKTEDLDGALHCYQQALALSPQHGAIHCNLGCLWQQQGKRTEAVAAYQRAIEYQPDLWTAYQNLVGLYLHEGDLVSALDLVRSALNHHPQAAPLHLLLGDIYRQRGDLTLALNAYREAIRCDDRCVSAYQNLGGTLMMVNNTTGAKICFKKALDIQPGIAGIYRNLGEIYEAEGDYLKAQECFLYTLSLDPDQLDALIKLEHLRLTLCDWEQYESRMTQMLNRLETADSTPIVPLTLNCFPVPPALHRQINEQWSRGIMHRMAGLKTNLNFQFPSEQPQKIKIGYLSADFRQHAVGSLIAPLFQYHDRSRFEVYAYSLSATTDELTEQVQQGCDHFQNIAALGTEEAARLIHQDGIHILIDLGGYTNLCRPEILALQPAPIQMQYIGYPDTMGAEFVPYILADRWIIPDRLENYYTESLVALPHTFVTAPIVLPQPPTREELGLPETGVVYACFNRTDKFSPDLFARWMQILQQVPDSVLWLVEVTPDTTERLYQTAKGYGIEKERLVFLKKRSWVEFMSVCQQADLFLDSFIYNAGATAVCAIQAGVPILTCPGETFASRMGASICHAADLESFVCQTPEDYQTQGIYWGQHPDELRSVQQCLRTQKANLPLFQPQAWMQALETQLFALAIVSEGKIS